MLDVKAEGAASVAHGGGPHVAPGGGQHVARKVWATCPAWPFARVGHRQGRRAEHVRATTHVAWEKTLKLR